MKRAIIVSLIMLLVVVSVVTAVTGSFDLSWHTVDGGGGFSSSGTYTLVGSIGQADAGRPSSNGSYSLSGGFLGRGRGAGTTQQLFLPIVTSL